jgi:hypothetical protein
LLVDLWRHDLVVVNICRHFIWLLAFINETHDLHHQAAPLSRLEIVVC